MSEVTVEQLKKHSLNASVSDTTTSAPTQKYDSFKDAAMASYQDYKDVYTRLGES